MASNATHIEPEPREAMYASALAALHETTLAISQQGDLQDLLSTIVQQAARLLGASMGGIYLMRPDGASLELVTDFNLPGNILGTVLRLGEGLSGKVAERGETMIVEDYMSWEGRALAYEGLPFRRVIGVPMKIGDRVIGVINVTDTETAGAFNPEEVRLVEVFAQQAALAVRLARLVAEVNRRQARLSGLYQLTVAISDAPDQETLLRRLYEQAASVFHFDGFAVALCHEDGCHEYSIALAMEDGEPVAGIHGAKVTTEEGGLIAWVLRTGQRLLLKDTEHEPMPVKPRQVGLPSRSWMAAPFLWRNQVRGAVVLQARQPYAFDEGDLRLLEGMAGQVGLALEGGRLMRETHRRDTILEALAYVGQQLLEPSALGRVLPGALARLGQATGVSRCYIFENLTSADGTLLMTQRYEWAAPGITPQIDNPELQNLPYYASGFGRWAELLGAGQPVYGLVAEFPDAERAILEPQDIRSIVVVPIYVGERWWGFIGFDECVSDRVWSAAEIETLRSAAGVIGAALARHEAEKAEQRQRLLAETLRDTALSLASTLSLDELLDRILTNVRRVVPNDRASLMLIEGDEARVMGVSHYGEAGLGSAARPLSFRISDTLNLATMMKTRQPVVILDVGSFPGWVNLPETEWVRAYVGAPIESQGQVVGFINLDFADPAAVPPDAPQVLQAFAAQVGTALTNARLYRAMEAYSARARQLAMDVMRAHELERQAVARELHDEMWQALTALLLDLGLLERHLPADLNASVWERLTEARWLTEQTAARIRDLSLNLRPPALDALGLVPALREYLSQYAHRTGLQVEFQVSKPMEEVPSEIALALYRIVQEATTNISRHANASQIRVAICGASNAVSLVVTDNGQGFDSQAVLAVGSTRRGSGLLGMRERAAALGGYCTIVSQPGEGTRIEVFIPLGGAQPEHKLDQGHTQQRTTIVDDWTEV